MPGAKHIDQYTENKIIMVSKLEYGLLNIPLLLLTVDTVLPPILLKEKVLWLVIVNPTNIAIESSMKSPTSQLTIKETIEDGFKNMSKQC